MAAALADARHLFGPDVVLLESVPPAGETPARVTVAFDGPPRPAPPVAPAAPPPAPTAFPSAAQTAPGRSYGYGAARNVSPPAVEPTSAAPNTLASLVASLSPPPVPSAAPLAPSPTLPSVPRHAAPPADALGELAAMRARIAELEAALTRTGTGEARPTLVLVGPAGAGRSSLALRLAARPELLEAASAGVLVVPPEHTHADPTPMFWAAGVPAVYVETADDVQAARETLAGADVLIVDTPPMPLDPVRAAPVVRRLAALLAPLAPLDVVFVVEASRAREALSADQIAALGLAPDGLAVTRLDEAAAPAAAWASALKLPLRFTSAGPAADLLVGTASTEPVTPAEPDEPAAPAEPAAKPTAAAKVALDAPYPTFEPVSLAALVA